MRIFARGSYAWSPKRFLQKTEQLARVLAVAGEESFPHLVGLAEVENEDCLQFLLRASSLKNVAYRYIYAESADPRGIDVCLLYNRFVFKPLAWESIRPSFSDENKNQETSSTLMDYCQMNKYCMYLFVICLRVTAGSRLPRNSDVRQPGNCAQELTPCLAKSPMHLS